MVSKASSQLKKGDTTMRVMVIGRANKESEAGVLPDPKILADMIQFNEELVKAGVMLACEGLHSSAKGKRVRISGTSCTVIDGPFTESKELIAGFQLWQVRSMEEAVEWVKRAPNCGTGDSEVEIRQVFDMEDFAPNLPPDFSERKLDKERMWTQVAANKV
jgi:hypothetical protein